MRTTIQKVGFKLWQWRWSCSCLNMFQPESLIKQILMIPTEPKIKMKNAPKFPGVEVGQLFEGRKHLSRIGIFPPFHHTCVKLTHNRNPSSSNGRHLWQTKCWCQVDRPIRRVIVISVVFYCSLV